MPGPVLLLFGEEFQAYRHSGDHPLKPERVRLAFELMESVGLTARATVVPPRAATVEELGLVHDAAYIETVRALSDARLRGGIGPAMTTRAGFGSGDNPVFEGMHSAAAVAVGASLAAAEAVGSGSAAHAFNPGGGWHHAMPDRASGFCVYNDAAVAIEMLRRRGHRVAYVDVDVHHGDGVEAIFAGCPEVLTISLHETGRHLFPGTGFPSETGDPGARRSAANLPFEPFTWDEPWRAGFDAVVPALLRRFRPTVLITQDGCDTHLLDPLAHLRASTRIWPHVGRAFHELAHELCAGRWVALGGGGYAWRDVVPRAWTLLLAEMVENPAAAAHLLDAHEFPPAPELQQRVWAFLRRDLDALGRAHGLALSL